MSDMSLRQTAKQLGITPAYLSYMVNGKRPWRPELYQRYCQLVNTSVNTTPEKTPILSTKSSSHLHGVQGAARSNRAAPTIFPRHLHAKTIQLGGLSVVQPVASHGVSG